MKRYFNLLTGGAIGTLAIWVNKLVGLFAGSGLALSSWQHQADITAGAFGTGVAFVISAIAVFALPRWLRPVVAFLFLAGSLFFAWQCQNLHDLLASTAMATPDSDRLRDLMRLDYIGMLLTFVAALACATAAWWSETSPSKGQPAS
jgi:glucan phosphoethanolaminetransferase (alkaline phosphatase superfamily)